MNVRDLIDSLNSQIDQGLISEDSEVRFAYQPNYPLWTQLGHIHPGTKDAQSTIVPEDCETCGGENLEHDRDCPERFENREDPESAPCVYLVESGWDNGYASRKLFDEVEQWL